MSKTKTKDSEELIRVPGYNSTTDTYFIRFCKASEYKKPVTKQEKEIEKLKFKLAEVQQELRDYKEDERLRHLVTSLEGANHSWKI